jgi:uncharacterized protein DUF3443
MGMAAPFLLGMMCLLILVGCGGGNASSTVTSAKIVNNTVAVTVGFGPNGQAGGYVNGLYATVTVCQHGTAACATIDNVLVDTGSVGLRILPSALGSVALTPVLLNGNALEECVQFGDTSYAWGPVQLADVNIAGETASNIPIQLIGDTTIPVYSSCFTTPINQNLANGGDDDTLATLGANGILGIGLGTVDCGERCSIGSFDVGYPYVTCPGGVCNYLEVPASNQTANPVAAFTSSDKNGVMITLPSVSATGAATVSGTMNFGIDTQADNALGSATLFALDQCGFLPMATFNGVTYSEALPQCTDNDTGVLGALLDSGSSALYILDSSALSSLGIYNCAEGTSGYGGYCVRGAGTAALSGISLAGNGVGTGTISLNIGDATTLINTENAVFNDLAGPSVASIGNGSTGYFDLGLPFFLGRTVFVGIPGETVPNGAGAPFGFVAF